MRFTDILHVRDGIGNGVYIARPVFGAAVFDREVAEAYAEAEGVGDDGVGEGQAHVVARGLGVGVGTVGAFLRLRRHASWRALAPPFLIAMRERGAERPFLLVWVENEELLVPVTK